METPAVRVLVVGDSGVGKTTLLRAVCRDAADPADADARAHRWTTGCDVHVLLYQYREAYGAMRDVFVEFVDVGGHPKYDISRAMFYHDVLGIVLVHDLTNAKSYDHLRQWISEINETQRLKGCVLPAPFSSRATEFPSLAAMPKLVIGNKRDQVGVGGAKRTSALAELRTVEAIEASAEPFSLDQNAFYNFLDRVVAFSSSRDAAGGAVGGSINADFQSAFADGLRQTNSKSKPEPISPSLGMGTKLNTAVGWWR